MHIQPIYMKYTEVPKSRRHKLMVQFEREIPKSRECIGPTYTLSLVFNALIFIDLIYFLSKIAFVLNNIVTVKTKINKCHTQTQN